MTPTAVIVQNRGSTRRIHALGMAGDEREIPAPLTRPRALAYWLGFGGFSGEQLDLLGEGEALIPGHEAAVLGHIALAVSDDRLLGIVASTDATGPAVWLGVSLADLDVSSSGVQGLIKKRPQRIEVRHGEQWELLLGHVRSLDRKHNASLDKQEWGLLGALTGTS